MKHASLQQGDHILSRLKLELKALPPHMRYVFLGRYDTFVVIIAFDLNGKKKSIWWMF